MGILFLVIVQTPVLLVLLYFFIVFRLSLGLIYHCFNFSFQYVAAQKSAMKTILGSSWKYHGTVSKMKPVGPATISESSFL